MPPLRIRIVHFLNAAPLAWGFLRGSCQGPEVEVRLMSPADCAEGLREGSADAALVPVIELMRIPGLRVVGSTGVAARGKVDSVLVVSRTAPLTWPRVAAAPSVALDDASRTSQALFRTLLRMHGLREPKLEEMPCDPEERLRDHEAALLIGDAALRLQPAIRAGELGALDLGEEWARSTRLPFVFAIWAVRPGIDALTVTDLVTRSRDEGVARIAEIAAANEVRIGLPRADLERYLRERLVHRIGAEERAGMARFFEEAARAGVIEGVRPVEFAG